MGDQLCLAEKNTWACRNYLKGMNFEKYSAAELRKEANVGLTIFFKLLPVLKCLSYLRSVQTLNLFVTALTWTTTQSLFSSIQVVCPQQRTEPSQLELRPAAPLTWSYHHCCTTLWPKPGLGTATECHTADVANWMHSFASRLLSLLPDWTTEA